MSAAHEKRPPRGRDMLHQNFIAGEWTEGVSVNRDINPSNLDDVVGERLPSVRAGVEVEIMREPEGVIGIITPWNFPIAIPAWKIAPALAYGNCVVFTPADLVPGCGWALADIIARAGV